MIHVLAAASPGEVRVAVADGDDLLDYAIWRPGAPDGVGDLHRGRILSIVPAMAGAFVAIAGAEGFLPDSATTPGHTEGAIIAVRVTRAAQSGKGPRLSTRIDPTDNALAGNGPVALLRRGPGGVARLAALYPDAPVLVDDMALAATLRPGLGDRLAFTRTVFDDAIAEQIDALANPEVGLVRGARMSIQPTRALVAIDLDAGAASSEKQGKAAAQLGLNRALIPAVVRQIRLRNLSGAIVIDVAGMPARKRAALAPAFTDALARDPLRPRFLGFSALGFAEILRPRIHPPLHELLSGPHAAGLAALRALVASLAADPSRPQILRAAPAIIVALENDPLALDDFARLAGRRPALQSDPHLSTTSWRMEAAPRAQEAHD